MRELYNCRVEKIYTERKTMTNILVGLTASNTISGHDIYVRVPDNLDVCYVMKNWFVENIASACEYLVPFHFYGFTISYSKFRQITTNAVLQAIDQTCYKTSG